MFEQKNPGSKTYHGFCRQFNRSAMLKIPCYVHKICHCMFTTTFFYRRKKYCGILDVSYQIYGAYIIVLFTRNLSKVCFQHFLLATQNYCGVCV